METGLELAYLVQFDDSVVINAGRLLHQTSSLVLNPSTQFVSGLVDELLGVLDLLLETLTLNAQGRHQTIPRHRQLVSDLVTVLSTLNSREF